MSVSSRLRYEVLRRDNYTCRYCGGTPPNVTLTVDHVTPVTLGGSDDPSNLVAACSACNSGKSATPVDAALVENVRDDALRWSTAMAAVVKVRTDELAAERAVIARFDSCWTKWTAKHGPVPREAGWRGSIVRFLAAGLDEEFLGEAVQKSMVANRVPIADVWRYFCGICWRELNKRREMASELLANPSNTDARQPDQEFPYMEYMYWLLMEIVGQLGGDRQAQRIADKALFEGMSNANRIFADQIAAGVHEDEAHESVMASFEADSAKYLHAISLTKTVGE